MFNEAASQKTKCTNMINARMLRVIRNSIIKHNPFIPFCAAIVLGRGVRVPVGLVSDRYLTLGGGLQGRGQFMVFAWLVPP